MDRIHGMLATDRLAKIFISLAAKL